ncbi:MAG: LysE family transporter [bacterium]
MEHNLLLQGIIIGFSLALPIGPIGVLCIRKTLAEGHAAGIAIGLGAALADSLYGCVAAFGLTVISNLLIAQGWWLRLIGGAFLCYLGIRTYFTRPVENGTTPNGKGLFASFFSTFLLTLTNPLTILAFIGVFTALGLGNGILSMRIALELVLGVFLGSCSWFLLLTYGIASFRKKINSNGLGWINRISGALILLFGIIALISF